MLIAHAIPDGAVCPWPQKLRHLTPRKKHRNRIRVRIRSFVDKHVLRTCSEAEARLMCAEDSFGQAIEGLEPVAIRMTRLKAPFTDIRLLVPERRERRTTATITRAETENNAFVHEGVCLGPLDSMRELDAATGKIEAWPEVYDQKNVIVCAGRIHGAIEVPREELAAL